jgi:hypothetical protein
MIGTHGRDRPVLADDGGVGVRAPRSLRTDPRKAEAREMREGEHCGSPLHKHRLGARIARQREQPDRCCLVSKKREQPGRCCLVSKKVRLGIKKVLSYEQERCFLCPREHRAGRIISSARLKSLAREHDLYFTVCKLATHISSWVLSPHTT